MATVRQQSNTAGNGATMTMTTPPTGQMGQWGEVGGDNDEDHQKKMAQVNFFSILFSVSFY
jgi:hypothetical protein